MALDTNLVSYWKLDEVSGNRVDATLTGNTLADINTVGDVVGKIGNAANLVAANNECLSITDGAQTGLGVTGDFSISMWVKVTSFNNPYGSLLTKSGLGGDSYILSTGTHGDNTNVNFYNGADYASWKTTTALTSADIGVWVHLVFTVDVSSATGGIIYRNGVAQSMSAKTGTATSIGTCTAPFTLGGTTLEANRCIDGAIDEVGFWDRVLTANEVAELYNANRALAYPLTVDLTTSIISYWKLEETSSTRYDAVPLIVGSQGGNNLAEVNTVGYSGGIIGNAASFVAANSERLSISNGDQTGLNVSGVYSVSFWIKPTSVPTYYTYFGKGDGYTYGYEVSQAAGDMYINWAQSPTGPVYGQFHSHNVITNSDIGNWVHIVCTLYANSTAGGIIYKNGVAQSMEAKTGTALSINTSTAEFTLGGRNEIARYVDGEIDETGFWARVLTPTEVTYLYNAGAPTSVQQYPFEVLKHFSPFPSHYNT